MKMSVIVGVDEVGRGAWAGPVVAAAVILKSPIEGLTDSKLLAKPKRQVLSEIIQKKALAIGIGWTAPAQIDQLGLSKSIALAMKEAIDQIKLIYDQIIIDGAFNFLADNPKATVLIRADQIIPSVSAASIIAKVARDKYMADIAKNYPNYFFEKHVGYGTKLHQDSLKKYGLCDLHRRSYRPIRAFI